LQSREINGRCKRPALLEIDNAEEISDLSTTHDDGEKTMFTMTRTLALALALAGLVPATALPQAYPSKPIRLIVPFPAGGGVDYIGRIVGKGLSERLGQQVLVDNRPGANAIVGLEALKASAPDGYTIAAASAGPLAVNPFVYAKLPHDTVRDFT
jgi:tripartite-type tricarboxylate transporter receptor subunit TctC